MQVRAYTLIVPSSSIERAAPGLPAHVLITTVPFGAHDPAPLTMLDQLNQGTSPGGANEPAVDRVRVTINPLDRKLTAEELAEMVRDVTVIIAGTEPITAEVMDSAPGLQLIARVGVGLDSVDLAAARDRGIAVTYTPEAPAPAVAELTITLMLSLLRQVPLANTQMHRGSWHRHTGRRLAHSTIGIIGAGRIGGRVIAHLTALGTHRILVHDVQHDPSILSGAHISWATMDEVLQESHVVSVHVPLTAQTRGLIAREQLQRMRPDAYLINTARGGIVNEDDLVDALLSGTIAGAAVDVFEHEPYSGPLAGIESCLLTAHMGSMSIDCRSRMEIEATAEAVRLIEGRGLVNPVPPSEYPD